MPEKLQDTWPEAFVSTAETAVAVSRAVKAGRLRKLASRLYTTNLTDDPNAIVRRNLWRIVGGRNRDQASDAEVRRRDIGHRRGW